MLSYHGVGKTFGARGQFRLHPLDLEVREGSTLVLLGSSGSGKSSLLKLTNRLLELDSGRIRFRGRDIRDYSLTELRRQMGYVLQRPALLPHLSVRANVGLPLKLLGWDKPRRRQRVAELLDLVELPGDYAERMPWQLSGGQQQRISVARALAADPPLLLMDEPFGALDGVTRQIVQESFQALQRRLVKTVVFVTHDLLEALMLADEIAVLHEGRLQQLGTPDSLINEPATDFVRDLVARPATQMALLHKVGA
ncbi:MAG: ATP-binding cassette domain-containing protein [Verrucomicrobiota bacterium]